MRHLAFLHPLALALALAGSVASAPSSTAVPGDDACALITPAEILKTTGLKVSDGAAGAAIPGVLGRCTWSAGHNRVIVTLADARHMQITVAAWEHSGGTSIPGLGSKAVGIKADDFTGGGYIVSVLDAKGGFGISLLGSAGSHDNVIAMAKIVESRR